jgi:hypothetical protein
MQFKMIRPYLQGLFILGYYKPGEGEIPVPDGPGRPVFKPALPVVFDADEPFGKNRKTAETSRNHRSFIGRGRGNGIFQKRKRHLVSPQ